MSKGFFASSILTFLIRLQYTQISPAAIFCKPALILATAALVSACSVNPTVLTSDPLLATVEVLKTEQAVLRFQLSELDRLSQSASPTTSPASFALTATPVPTLAEPEEITVVLPHPVCFLRPDESGLDQVYRLDRDGKTLTQLTFEPTAVIDYDVAIDGDLAYVRRPVEDTAQLVIASVGSMKPQVVLELTGAEANIQYVRWLPDGNQLVYHRTVIREDDSTPETGQPATTAELVLYNQLTTGERLLLQTGPQPSVNITPTVYTDESLEYADSKDWTPAYQVTAATPDGRYLLINDHTAPFWLVYDLRLDTARQLNIAASSADFSPDGQSVCLSSNTFQPDFNPPQALLCANLNLNSITVHLSDPWQPFGINYWSEENAVIFLQKAQQEDGTEGIELYGLNFNTAEPLLLRSESFIFIEPDIQAQILYASQENQDQGLILLAGQAHVARSPGLVLLPLDPQKPAIYLAEPGEVRQPRWDLTPIP